MSLWKALAGLINDTTVRNIRVDSSTHTLQTIEYDHHEIHAGSSFFYTDSVELASAATQDYLITTPNTTKWAHFIFSATGNAITQAQLYEGADRTGTTSQTIYNMNRNSATTATVTVHKGTSGGTTDGTLIWQLKSGSSSGASRTPMASERQNELILKQNTKYILRITSGTNANLTNVRLQWYEHTEKG